MSTTEQQSLHTAGPWRYNELDGLILREDGEPIGCAYDNPDTGLERMDEEPSRFNGYLMAASPSLLYVAEWAARYASNPDAVGSSLWRGLEEAAKAAITAARGEGK